MYVSRKCKRADVNTHWGVTAATISLFCPHFLQTIIYSLKKNNNEAANVLASHPSKLTTS